MSQCDQTGTPRPINCPSLIGLRYRPIPLMCTTIQIFNDVTEYFSCSTPSLPMVIPAIHIVDDFLDEHLHSINHRFCICRASTLANSVLNTYYKKTDQSNVYRIAMVLHLSHKLQYFKQYGWATDWIDTVRELMQDEYDSNYSNSPCNSQSTTQEDVEPPKVKS